MSGCHYVGRTNLCKHGNLPGICEVCLFETLKDRVEKLEEHININLEIINNSSERINKSNLILMENFSTKIKKLEECININLEIINNDSEERINKINLIDLVLMKSFSKKIEKLEDKIDKLESEHRIQPYRCSVCEGKGNVCIVCGGKGIVWG